MKKIFTLTKYHSWTLAVGAFMAYGGPLVVAALLGSW